MKPAIIETLTVESVAPPIPLPWQDDLEQKMNRRIWNRLWQLLFVMTLLFGAPAAAQDSPGQILVLSAAGPITPAMAEYLVRGIQTAPLFLSYPGLFSVIPRLVRGIQTAPLFLSYPGLPGVSRLQSVFLDHPDKPGDDDGVRYDRNVNRKLTPSDSPILTPLSF